MKSGTEVRLTKEAAKLRLPEMRLRTGTVVGFEGDKVRVKWNGQREIWTEEKENLEVRHEN